MVIALLFSIPNVPRLLAYEGITVSKLVYDVFFLRYGSGSGGLALMMVAVVGVFFCTASTVTYVSRWAAGGGWAASTPPLTHQHSCSWLAGRGELLACGTLKLQPCTSCVSLVLRQCRASTSYAASQCTCRRSPVHLPAMPQGPVCLLTGPCRAWL
jgi:hypothetical protein